MRSLSWLILIALGSCSSNGAIDLICVEQRHQLGGLSFETGWIERAVDGPRVRIKGDVVSLGTADGKDFVPCGKIDNCGSSVSETVIEIREDLGIDNSAILSIDRTTGRYTESKNEGGLLTDSQGTCSKSSERVF